MPNHKIPCLDFNDVTNFRHISMLPVIGKIVYKNISKQLINFINNNNMFDIYQSAYKKGHNTKTALLANIHDIYLSLDKHSCI